MDMDLPDVVTEVREVFASYEAALVGNDVPTLEVLVHDAFRMIRFGATENLNSMDEIRVFRRDRSPAKLARTLKRTAITAFGRDLAVASTRFRRDLARARIGRPSQIWIRFDDGWKIVSAHVRVIDEA